MGVSPPPAATPPPGSSLLEIAGTAEKPLIGFKKTVVLGHAQALSADNLRVQTSFENV